MDKISEFRQKIRDQVDLISSVIEEMSHKDVSKLIHEFWLRQINLEVQNEEFRKAQLDYEAAYKKYTDFYDRALFGYCLFDRDGFIRETNLTFADQLGIERTQIVNTQFFDYLFTAEDREIFSQYLQHVFAMESRRSCEIRLLNTKGSQVSVRLESSIMPEQELPAMQCQTAIFDISEYKHAEEGLKQSYAALEELVKDHSTKLSQTSQQLARESSERKRFDHALRISEHQYQLLAEHVADGIAIIRKGKTLFANTSFRNMFGFNDDQKLWNSPDTLVHKDYRTRFQKILIQLEKNTSLQHFQVPCVTETQREIWIEGELSVIEWMGTPAILMTVREITDRKDREEAMKQEKNRLQREISTLKMTMKDRYQFGDIIGKSLVMQSVYEQIMKATTTDANVFIYGESGTGKELVARTIHKMSKRREQRFIPVNCGAIPESLFESEFFGHRKGSFTGAFRDKQGFFSVAHKGTLFLDELGELSPIMQVKLLRVLDDGEYIPLGDTMVKKVDVRIIAATNKNIEDLRERGLIREDFFFRIHVFTITIPPLRERKEDIPLLIDHFLERYESHESLSTIPGDIMEMLYDYDWPGNIREFQNVLQRYLSGQPLRLDARQGESLKNRALLDTGIKSGNGEFREVTEDFEKRLILNVLEQHRWNKSKTAATLGIPRRTLYRKMEKYRII